MQRSIVALLAICGSALAHAAESPQPNGSTSTSATTATPTASTAPRVVGYLPAGTAPSSAALAPAPPTPGSAAMARDEDANRNVLALHGTPRWDLATQDAVLTFPAVAQTFSCALGAPVSEEQTPHLMRLLRRTLIDAGRSTSEAKRKYQRARPFMVNGKPICTPDREAALRADGSYPSGHSAIGWAFGLVLAEVSPAQANEVLARGRAFGQSRAVCNVHWQSDVLEGQMIASAVVARMHAEAEFRTDLEAARAELAALRAQNPSNPRDCKIEAHTLQQASN